MKTYKDLFIKIVSFDNLLQAAHRAAKGKRERACVLIFFYKLEDNLYRLREQLLSGTYKPGEYDTFYIYQPKTRMISAAPFRNRVVHHALIKIVGPLLERGFIFDSYANQKGKGTHKAIFRYQDFLQKYRYVLKCDIKKYFPSIDHDILKNLVRKRIACPPTLGLIDTIIDGSNPQEKVYHYFLGDTLFTPTERPRGLPIGNLTSQVFANYYLDPLDHFVKETLRCRAYVRYVDDFVLLADSKSQLWEWKREIARFLQSHRLKLHPRRCQVYPAKAVNRFLGQVVFRTHRRLPSENVRRFAKRLKRWREHPPGNLQQRLAAWTGHARQANTKGLLKSLGLGKFPKGRG
jgi:retron-type reverse transcriptase